MKKVFILFCFLLGAGIGYSQISYNWSNGLGLISNNLIVGLHHDLNNNSIVTGYTNGCTDIFFGDSSVQNNQVIDAENLNFRSFIVKNSPTDELVWEFSLDAELNASCIDDSGNVYIMGRLYGSADFDPNPTTSIILTAPPFFTYIFLAKYSNDGSLSWAKMLSGTNVFIGSSMYVDNAGSLFITGYHTEYIDLDPGPLVQNVYSDNSWGNIFFAKYTNNGDYVWGKSIGGSDLDRSTKIGTNNAGEVILTGNFKGTSDFDPSFGVYNLSTGISLDGFFAKYSSTGNFVYAKHLQNSGDDVINDMTWDDQDNIYITGRKFGFMDADPGPGVYTLPHGGQTDIYFAKYNSSGDFLLAGAVGNANPEEGHGIAVDSNHLFYITGHFFGTADFNTSPTLVNTLTGPNRALYVACYNDTGGFVWGKSFANSTSTNADDPLGVKINYTLNHTIEIGGNYGISIDLDPSPSQFTLETGKQNVFYARFDSIGGFLAGSEFGLYSTGSVFANDIQSVSNGNILIAGSFDDKADFESEYNNGQDAPTSGHPDERDIFLASYDSLGNLNWVKNFRTNINSGNQPHRIIQDSIGNIFIGGTFGGTVDFDPGPFTFFQTSQGGTDIYISKFDSNGIFLWAKSFGGASDDELGQIKIDSLQNLIVTGNFSGTADFDPGPATNSLTDSFSYPDAFVAKYNSNGDYINVFQIGGGGGVFHYIRDLTIDHSSNIIISGVSWTDDYDPGPASTSSVPMHFVAKYDPTLQLLWTYNIASPSDLFYGQGAKSIAVDTYDNIYIAGRYSDSIYLAPDSIGVMIYSNGISDVFLLKLTPSGETDYYTHFGGTGSDDIGSIAIDAAGKLVLAGTFSNTVVFDSVSPYGTLINPFVYKQLFILQYDSAFQVISSVAIEGDHSEAVEVLLKEDELILVDRFDHFADYKPGPDFYVYTATWGSALVSYTNLCLTPIIINPLNNVTVCNGESLTLSASASGSYPLFYSWEVDTGGGFITVQDTLIYSGFDSPNLTIITVDSLIDMDVYRCIVSSSCGTSDTSMVTLVNVYPTYQMTQSLTLCLGDSIVVNGNVYSSSGTYLDNCYTINGCDSIVETNLTIVTIDTSVVQIGNMLSSNANLSLYQWLDCTTSNSISGENSQTFYPDDDGFYAVEIITDGCIDTSACQTFNFLDLVNEMSIALINIYPNPSGGVFHLESNQLVRYVELYNQTGGLISLISINSNSSSLKFGSLSPGVYYLRIVTENGLTSWTQLVKI